MYEGTKEHFNKLKKQYEEYMDLYRFFNNGSLEGVTPFDEFYWRCTFFGKYLDLSRISLNN